MSQGIKETLEVLNLIKELAKAVESAKADGSINWFDLPKLGPVVLSAKTAIEGSQNIDDELKDLDSEEIKVLAANAMEAVQLLAKAFLSK